MNIAKFIPAVNWIKNYNKDHFKSDLIAGITVGVMLIPQGMAYAMIAGLPPIYGLYASTIPLIVYALFGSSRQLAVGPVAMVSLLTAAGISILATPGSEGFITLAILLALMVGVIQFGLGVFKLGFLVNLLSHPVISGFTSAAALIIGFSQLKHILGLNLPRSQHIHEILFSAVENVNETHLLSVAVGIGSLLLMILMKKLHKSIPVQLVVVVLGVLVVWLAGLNEKGLKIVEDIPKGFPDFSLPSLDFGAMQAMFVMALTIAVIGFMESIAVAKAVNKKHKDYEIEPNQELIGLGLANIAGSFFQSFPVTGGFSRTAVNDQAGAKTGLASIVSAVLISLTLLFLTPLFYYLPNAILASIIILAVSGLVDWKEAKFLWRANRIDFFMLLITFLSTLIFGIELGISVGVSLSVIMMIFRTTRPHIAELARIPGTDIFKNVDRFDDLENRNDILIMRFDAQLYFANVQYFKDQLTSYAGNKGESLKLIILDASSINYIDSTACHALSEIIEYYKDNNVSIHFANLKGPVRDAFKKSLLTEELGENSFFISIQAAIVAFDKNDSNFPDHGINEYVLQVN